MEYLKFFLPGTIELIGIIALSLTLARVPLRWERIAIAGVVLTTILLLLKFLPHVLGPVGLNALIILLLLIFLISITTRVNILKIVIYVFVSFGVLALLETIIFKGFLALTKLDIEYVRSKVIMWLALGIFQAIMLNVIALLVGRFRKPAEGMWRI